MNRSLTRSELELQRAFNAHFGYNSCRVVVNPMCDVLPDLQSEMPSVSQTDLAAFIARMQAMIAHPKLLALFPETESYQIGALESYAGRFPDPDDVKEYPFTAEQLNLLAKMMSKALISGIQGLEPDPAKRDRGDTVGSR